LSERVKPFKTNKMKNYQAILMIVIGFGLGIQTLNGVVQMYIPFAGVKNEIAFAFVGIMMGTLGIFAVDYKKILKALI